MELIKTTDAVGHILCHDLTQIIPGVSKGARFRKGHIVTEEDIPVLLSMGKENLYVWKVDENILHENDAAEILADACESEGMERSEAKEGKIELKSTVRGLLEIDKDRLEAINSIPRMMIATLPNFYPVEPGLKLCGTRIIPLVIEKSEIEKVKTIASKSNPIMKILPYKLKTASIIVTGSEVKKGLIKDSFSPVVVGKLREYGIKTVSIFQSGDEREVITERIISDKKAGVDLIVCTGGMSVDPDDRTPGAISDTGAEVVTYGAPTLPGAMFLLSYLAGTPLVGLPGCVMFAKRTIFDLVLPHIAAGRKVSADEVHRLGAGGLCQSCPECHYPNCAFGKGGL